jgi:hypothetical protein
MCGVAPSPPQLVSLLNRFPSLLHSYLPSPPHNLHQSIPLLCNIDMAAAVSFAGAASRVRALPTWSSSMSGDDHSALAMSVSSARPRSARPLRSPPKMMGNVNAGKGLFAPLVVVARNIVGRKRFNQLRGKAIALHSQVLYLLWPWPADFSFPKLAPSIPQLISLR